MKRIILALALCFSMSSVHADSYFGQSDNYLGDSTTCCVVDPCGWGSFSLGGDWLYWKTEQSGLIYGQDIRYDGEAFSERTLKPNFKYDSGFRLFADYTTANTLWKFCAAYTHIPGKGNDSYLSTNSISGFAIINAIDFSLFAPVLGNTSLNTLNSNWRSKLDYLDIDVSRTFEICNNFDLTPYLGLRFQWMKQRINIDGGFQPDEGGPILFDSQLRTRFSGAGLNGGIKGDWQFFEGFTLVGNIGGSLVYSHFHNSGNISLGEEGEPQYLDSYKNQCHRSVPSFDTFIGVKYAINCLGYNADIHAGWEQHVIFLTNGYTFNSDGTTTLQGLTLGASVGF